MAKPKSQIDKFREAAREHESDQDERTFNAALKALVTKKPENKPEKKSK